MQSSAFNYRFSTNVRGNYLPHEVLPLQLLEIKNQGHARRSDGQILLRTSAHGLDITVGDLAAQKTRFAIPKVAIEQTRLNIYFGWC